MMSKVLSILKDLIVLENDENESYWNAGMEPNLNLWIGLQKMECLVNGVATTSKQANADW
jgi:hypothetical protein